MASKNLSIIVVLLLIAVGGMYYFSEDSTSETEERQGPYVDSLAPDNRPSFTARRDTENVPQPVGENLAPGTALLQTTVLDSENEGEIDKLRVRVDEVLAYGSSTSPIATGTEFVFNITGYLQENPEYKDQLKEQNKIKMLVSHQKGMSLKDTDKKQEWTFVEFSQ